MDQDTDIDRLLGPEAAEEIRAAVASGEYESPEAAIREAVDLWFVQRLERQPWVRQALQEGLDDLQAGRKTLVTPEFWNELWSEARRRAGG
jgi:Arc/MetJ-type ribon-helix-helix transcriptional regulator